MLSRGNSHNALLLGVGTMGTNWFLLDSGAGRHLKSLEWVVCYLGILCLCCFEFGVVGMTKQNWRVIALCFCGNDRNKL